jgi:hypothetical protein
MSCQDRESPKGGKTSNLFISTWGSDGLIATLGHDDTVSLHSVSKLLFLTYLVRIWKVSLLVMLRSFVFPLSITPYVIALLRNTLLRPYEISKIFHS